MTTSKTRGPLLLLCGLMALGVTGVTAARQVPAVASSPTFAGTIRGSAVDSSAGVLPGVFVAATSTDGRVLGETVTNGEGEFRFDKLPAGAIALRFHLDGFADATSTVTIPASGSGASAGDGDVRIVQRLSLATLTETVVVRAEPAPTPPPAPPAIVPVPPHDQSAVCAPGRLERSPASRGTILSRVRESTRALFAPGDQLIIDGGTTTGIAVGQNLVARRSFRPTDQGAAAAYTVGEHSAGLLQIVAADEQTSMAVVIYACDAMKTGDYLVAFEPEPSPAPDPAGVPAFDTSARILFADIGQMFGVTGRMLVIDRGALDGVRTGQRYTLFRRAHRQKAPMILGEGIVVAVRGHSATIHVLQATDAIALGVGGDSAAPQAPPQRDRLPSQISRGGAETPRGEI